MDRQGSGVKVGESERGTTGTSDETLFVEGAEQGDAEAKREQKGQERRDGGGSRVKAQGRRATEFLVWSEKAG
ncbi:hypothetical protein E4U31_007940 [Claviceps sp. LM219 group G6]|nr:hypothetical protein E4U31_007940 [Claviceps sp. LM219 group G6]